MATRRHPRAQRPTAGADEVCAMVPRRLRKPLFWSPVAAVIAQLVLTAAAAAATGGGDFPRFRGMLTFL